jgi:hypothetical protein
MSTQNSKVRKAYRQGELVFVPISKQEMARLNSNTGTPVWNKLSDNVIREGEATGHKHEVVEESASTVTMLAPALEFMPGLPDLSRIGTDDRLLVAPEPVKVVHPEHKPLALIAGVYLIIVQREYDESRDRRILD